MKKILFISLVSLGALLVICCSKDKVTGPDKKEPDFAIEVTPQTRWASGGEAAEYQIKLTAANGFSAPCTLSVVGVPEGDSAAFGQDVIVPSDSLKLTVYTTSSTPRRTYDLVITGRSGESSHSDTVALVVASRKVTDYYPLAIGNSWTYTFLDENYQSWMTFTTTIETTLTVDGNSRYLFSGADSVYVYVKDDTIFSKSREIILPAPLEVGQSWIADSCDYKLIGLGPAILMSDGTRYENCLKIRKTDPAYPGDETLEWWAKDVGKVKVAEYYSGRYEAGMELVSFILH